MRVILTVLLISKYMAIHYRMFKARGSSCTYQFSRQLAGIIGLSHFLPVYEVLLPQ